MSAAKARPGTKATAKRVARGAAKGAAKSAAKSAARAASPKTVASSGQRIGRGTRWTEEQVSLLLTTVKGSATAKQAFETVARELGKSTGTVQQKYYNLQKAAGGGAARRHGRPPGSTNKPVAATNPGIAGGRGGTGGLPNATALRALTVDDLVGLATSVKAEIDRRRKALDAASKLLAG